MKKKYLISIVLIAVLLFFGYQFLYQNHRNINEEEGVSVATTTLINSFETNETEANKKYLDKTIILNGTITSVDINAKTIILDDKIFCILNTTENLSLNQKISIKGRLLGFDNLLSELKLDQCTIVK